jgi:dipicolinate synthase subunit B
MDLNGVKLGFCVCGSFCTFSKAFDAMKKLRDLGADIQPIFSDSAQNTDTRFGKAEYWIEQAEEISGKKIISSVFEAEPIGPQNRLDAIVIAPATSNTLAKIGNGVNDTPVTMAVKAHLRNNKPVVVAVSTNDALGVSLKNIGILMVRKNYFFVPFGQDNPQKKPLSMVADFEKIPQTVAEALEGRQIQPIVVSG